MAQRIDVQYIKFYTHGSAAPSVAPVKPVHTDTIPKKKKRVVYRISVDPVGMLGIVVAVSMLIMMAVGVTNLQKEQQSTRALERYVALLQQENEQLQAKYAAEVDLEAVEQTALALGMIPVEQAERYSIEVNVPMPEVEERISIWSSIGTFLTGLFA